jgi:DNA-binding transcriptional MerR regulator
MRPLLKISEIAKLAGVTPKTLRHYHKIGLIAEPERTESGYRLYTTRELLRLQHIRHLRALGLSLHQIKGLFSGKTDGKLMRTVLQSLKEELSAQIRTLEERVEKIESFLEKDIFDSLHQSREVLPSLEMVQEFVGENIPNTSITLWGHEKRIYDLLGEFFWPAGYQEMLLSMIKRSMTDPALYHQMLSLCKRIATLADVPEDSPEIERMARDYAHLKKEIVLHSELQKTELGLESPLTDTVVDLFAASLSPAQRRFFELALSYTSE